jgi:tRNA dimethylallyltransferase
LNAYTGPVLAIVGATGTGKSALALQVALTLRSAGREAEIVGADAMQLYRGMDIGTAKLPIEQRRGIPHHLLDELEVTEEASVAWYQPRARAAIADIAARGAVPILVGGSGLYVSSALYDFRFPPRDAAVRARLEGELERDGAAALYRRLRDVDPQAAAGVDAANGRRVVRALEIAELEAAGYGGRLPERPSLWRPAAIIGVHVERGELTARLDERAAGMWRDGMLEEVRGLVPHGLERGVTASRAIGYAQALAQLRGELDEDEAIAQTAQLTRRYARRQVSWFKRYDDLEWVAPTGSAAGAEAGAEAGETDIVRQVIDRLEQ